MEILQSSAGVKKTTRGRKPKAEAAQKDDAEPQVTKRVMTAFGEQGSREKERTDKR